MNLAVFIPVRLASTRLPSKAMMKIKGKPVFQYLVERVKRADEPDSIVLCTTTNPIDDEIVSLAKKIGIDSFRGNEVDVLERYRQAAREFNVKHIVNVDGDDIFCDPLFIDITSRILKSSNFDFIGWNNLPLGTSPVGIKVNALEKVCSLKETINTETGWGKFFTETGLFQVKYLSPDDPELIDTSIRLTLDYPEDFQLFEKIYDNLKEPFSLKDVINLLHKKPELQKINEKVKEIYWKNFSNKSTEVKMKKE